MNRKQLLGSSAALFLSALLTGAAYAQSVTQGAIVGTVEDASGAVVPGATIVIHNNGTNADVTLHGDDKGFFNAPLLQPGDYKVTITAGNFAPSVQEHVQVVVGQSTELRPHLGLGGTLETVTVSSEAPALNFESPDFTAVLDQRTLTDLPQNNRRWSSLALLTPGVVSDSNGFGLVAVRGVSPLLNNVMVDGADDNQAYFSEERGRTREAYSTSQDAVREFAVNTGVYSAEYGRAAGGVITSVTKSGTNQLHGEAYIYDRQSNWAAYTPLVTNTVQNSAGQFVNVPLKPKDLRKIFGFAAGGSIIKDKLFWHYTFDEHRHIFPGISKPSNPGTFFAQPDTTLPSGQQCDLTTGLVYTSSTPATATAAAGSTVDQMACTLAAREGLSSYSAGAAAYTTGLAALLPDLGYVPRVGDQEINTPKLDYELNSKNHIMLLYHRLRWDSPGGVQTASTATYSLDAFGNDFVKLDYGVAKWTSQLTSRISNELGYQYSRELDYETQQPYTAYTKANLTGSGSSAGNVPYVNLATSSGFNLGSPYYSYRTAYPDERKWQIFDTAYWVKGRHSIKFGVDLLHNYDLINNLFESNGVFNYTYIGNYFEDLITRASGAGTSVCDTGASQAASVSSSTKNGVTTYTLKSAVGTSPCYSSFAEGFGLTPAFDIATMDYGFFVQDNWKVTPRLTLELGLRYDYEQLPQRNAKLDTASSVVNTAGTTLYTFTPYAGLTNRPSDKNNIGPRIGLSYDLFGSGKSVVRAGYGMYYGRMINAMILNAYLNTGNPAGQYVATYRTTQGGPLLSNILPNVTANSSGAIVQQGSTFATPSSYYFSPNFQNPQMHEFDLAFGQDLGHNTSLSLSYLGALGRQLPNYLNTNLNPATRQNVTITVAGPNGNCGPIACGTTFTVPTYVNGSYTLNGSPVTYAGYNNTSFQNITEIVSNINSSYNGFVIELKNTNFHGLEIDGNYTWSHALDYSQNANTTASTEGWYDPYSDALVNYGNSSFNVPNRVVVYAMYRFHGVKGDSWLKYLANDWAISNTFQGQSGLPYSYGTSSFNSSAAIGSGWNGAGGISFVPMLGRNTLKQRRALVDDVRLEKGIAFTDRYKLQLRGDFFNIANHPNITNVNTTAYQFSSCGSTCPLTGTMTYQAATFGTATSINSSGFLYRPREVQISARLSF